MKQKQITIISISILLVTHQSWPAHEEAAAHEELTTPSLSAQQLANIFKLQHRLIFSPKTGLLEYQPQYKPKEIIPTSEEIPVPKTATSANELLTPLFERKTVIVLQQNSSTPWTSQATNNLIGNNPHLTWENLRKDDAMNCGYHALKNSILFIDYLLRNPERDPDNAIQNPVLQDQLIDPIVFQHFLVPWASSVYEDRKSDLEKNLTTKNITLPQDETMEQTLKDNRSKLTSVLQKSYVNTNDGHIKVENLAEPEVQNLIERFIKKDYPQVAQHLVVLSNEEIRFEAQDKDTLKETIPIRAMSTDEYNQIADDQKDLYVQQYVQQQMNLIHHNQEKITSFQKNSNDVIGVIWHMHDHWVSYVAIKKNGNVTIYKMNSIIDSKPNPTDLKFLLSFLDPKSNRPFNTLLEQ